MYEPDPHLVPNYRVTLVLCKRRLQAERVPVLRPKVAEKDGKTALVLGCLWRKCQACGDRWLCWETASRLDELLTDMLGGDVGVATRHFAPADQPAA